MDPITIALGLANFVPGILKLLAGDTAGQVAQKVVDAAKTVTGVDAEEALHQIAKNPEAANKFQDAMKELQADIEKLISAVKEIEDDLKVINGNPVS